VAELFLRSRFLEATFEDMLPTAHIDASTTQKYFCKFFLAVPFL
jgi:hypothetical protein